MKKIKKLKKITLDLTRISRIDDAIENDLYEDKDPIGNGHNVGVEIECFFPGETQVKLFETLLVLSKLDQYCCRDDDSSIEANGGQSMELKVVAPEKKIYKVIEKVSELLYSLGARVNNSCGLHVHIDTRYRNKDEVFKRLVNAQDFLFNLVPQSRRNSDYCIKNDPENYDDPEDRYDPENSGKHSAINGDTAYDTVEVRIHTGSVNHIKINNWIKMLLALVNNKYPKIPNDPNKVVKILKLNRELASYTRERISKFKGHSSPESD